MNSCIVCGKDFEDGFVNAICDPCRISIKNRSGGATIIELDDENRITGRFLTVTGEGYNTIFGEPAPEHGIGLLKEAEWEVLALSKVIEGMSFGELSTEEAQKQIRQIKGLE